MQSTVPPSSRASPSSPSLGALPVSKKQMPMQQKLADFEPEFWQATLTASAAHLHWAIPLSSSWKTPSNPLFGALLVSEVQNFNRGRCWGSKGRWTLFPWSLTSLISQNFLHFLSNKHCNPLSLLYFEKTDLKSLLAALGRSPGQNLKEGCLISGDSLLLAGFCFLTCNASRHSGFISY